MQCMMSLLHKQDARLNQMTQSFSTSLTGFREDVTSQVVGVANQIADLSAKHEEHVKRLEELEDMHKLQET